MGRQTKKQEGNRKNIYMVIGAIFALLLVVYIGFSIFFMSHFFWRTTLNDENVSGASADKVRQMWEQEIGGYSLLIQQRDGGTETLKGTDIGLKLEWDETVSEMIEEQNAFAWPFGLFRPQKLKSETIVDYDVDKFNTAVRNLECMSDKMQVMPTDATWSVFDAKTGFSVVPEKLGTALNKEKFVEELKSAILQMQDSFSIVDTDCYINPEITQENPQLIALVEQMNQYADTVITYQVGEKTQVLDIAVFGDWFQISDGFKLTLDEEKAAEYVSGLARTYNTCYSPKKFKTSYGPTVDIAVSCYGWKVDTEAEKAQIMEEIQAGKPVTRDLNYSMTANSHGENDYGDSYVEINLTAQHLYLYQDGKKILETDFVSGKVSNGNATPTGMYGITYTERNATLRGANYETPVSFWMPFNGNVGMHDATWRSKFGGTIYKTSGSHGCINLPYDMAEKIFSVVSKNYPVIVYELEGTEQRTTESTTPNRTENRTEEKNSESSEKTEESSGKNSESSEKTEESGGKNSESSEKTEESSEKESGEKESGGKTDADKEAEDKAAADKPSEEKEDE